MDKKCNKYEAYFTFASKDDFDAHISNCKECMQEKIKQEKLSFLIKDSSETYKLLSSKQKTQKTLIKIACSLLLFVSFGTFAGIEMYETHTYQTFVNSSETSVIFQQGLPIDDYGFFDYHRI